jgi:cold shock CspA family protein
MRHIREHAKPFLPRELRERPAPAPAVKEPERITGRVVAWYPDRQYGWVSPDTSGREIFVHARQLGGEVSVGDLLSFWVSCGPRGRTSAQGVEKLQGE